jgi:molybdopterin-containing oxidoreductase family iron-sulfur binding subunit
MAACPYGSRSFNFQDPRPFLTEIDSAYPTRMRGVVEKCTFCPERLEKGRMPACVEASDGAILFGDFADPESSVRRALTQRFSVRRKPDLGTDPGIYYLV